MNQFPLSFKPFGPSTILIEWPAKIDVDIIQDIVSFEKCITEHEQRLDTIITYNALTIRYNQEIHFDNKVVQLKGLYTGKKEQIKQATKCWEVPVCYDTIFGLDLEEIATQKKLSTQKIIQLHAAPSYLIYFIGFQPGFLYLGGLDKQIHTPRKATPRLRLDKGSVGIGGEQTGIYPQDSAGGWNIVGKSPIDFFDITKPQPCFAKAGDQIKFKPIDIDTFYQIEKEVQEGNYQLKFKSL